MKEIEVQTSSCKIMSHWYETYGVGNIVNNYVISLYDDILQVGLSR